MFEFLLLDHDSIDGLTQVLLPAVRLCCVLLRLHPRVILLERSRVREWILRVQVPHKFAELFHLELERLCRFEILASDRLLFALFEHVQIASNQLQLVCNLFELDSSVVIFLVDSLLFFVQQDCQLLLQFRVELLFVDALDAQIPWAQNRVVVD